jgi:hypothetical protein
MTPGARVVTSQRPAMTASQRDLCVTRNQTGGGVATGYALLLTGSQNISLPPPGGWLRNEAGCPLGTFWKKRVNKSPAERQSWQPPSPSDPAPPTQAKG